MSWSVRAKMYVNNTLVNIVTLKIPRTNSVEPPTNTTIENELTWSTVSSVIHDTGFDLFKSKQTISSYPSPFAMFGFTGNSYDFWNVAAMGYTIRYELITYDGTNRYIKLTPSITNDLTNDKSLYGQFEFGHNDGAIDHPIYYISIQLGQYYTETGSNYIRQTEYRAPIPWLSIDGSRVISPYIICTIKASMDEGYKKERLEVQRTYHDDPTDVAKFNEWLDEYVPEVTDEPDPFNPYEPGGTTSSGGGDGNFSEESDSPTTDELPTLSAIGTGMASIFTPSAGQLRHLADVMWNNSFFDFMQNLVENISDMFTSLAIVPFVVTPGSTVSVTWFGFDTAVSLTLAAKQYFEFNMGTIDLANDDRIFTSGSALDYSPFSQLGIYLPFIGYRELDIDECRGAAVNLRYRIDILSGACVAIVRVAGKDIYEFTGNCLAQIPITNENMQSLVSDAVNVGIALVNSQAAGGAAAADIAAAEGASTSEMAEAKTAHANAHLTQSRGQLASATANAAMGMKPSFAKSGNVSGADAMLAVKQPYLFLKTPRQAIPARYQKYCGFPSNITGRLGDFIGYTVVEDVRLNGLVATSPEVAEIYDLLKKGVII